MHWVVHKKPRESKFAKTFMIAGLIVGQNSSADWSPQMKLGSSMTILRHQGHLQSGCPLDRKDQNVHASPRRTTSSCWFVSGIAMAQSIASISNRANPNLALIRQPIVQFWNGWWPIWGRIIGTNGSKKSSYCMIMRLATQPLWPRPNCKSWTSKLCLILLTCQI